jgi:hypothetical protein
MTASPVKRSLSSFGLARFRLSFRSELEMRLHVPRYSIPFRSFLLKAFILIENKY